MNVTERSYNSRPNVSTLRSSVFIRGDLSAVTCLPTFFVFVYRLYPGLLVFLSRRNNERFNALQTSIHHFNQWYPFTLTIVQG